MELRRNLNFSRKHTNKKILIWKYSTTYFLTNHDYGNRWTHVDLYFHATWLSYHECMYFKYIFRKYLEPREAISKNVYIHFPLLCKKVNRRGKRSLPVIPTRMKVATKKLGNPRAIGTWLPINQRTRERRKMRKNSQRWFTRMHNYPGSWRMSSKKVSNTVSLPLSSILHSMVSVIYENKIQGRYLKHYALLFYTDAQGMCFVGAKGRNDLQWSFKSEKK